MITVLDYLPKQAETADLASAAHYLAIAYGVDPAVHEGVAARGVRPGTTGGEPAEVIET
ncbi:MAG: hypothetical protein R2742_11980 [Micropruina glycogenica]